LPCHFSGAPAAATLPSVELARRGAFFGGGGSVQLYNLKLNTLLLRVLTKTEY
jgi:hypothetical protein